MRSSLALALVLVTCGHGAAVAAEPAVKLIHAKEVDVFEAELRDSAADGYRLLAFDSGAAPWKFWYAPGRIDAVLLRNAAPKRFEYKVVRLGGAYTTRKGRARLTEALAQAGKDGFRIVRGGPGAVRGKSVFSQWAGFEPFLIMEKSPAATRQAHQVLVSASETELVAELNQAGASGFDVASVVATTGLVIVVVEKGLDAALTAPSEAPGSVSFAYVTAKRSKTFFKELLERAAEGYRVVGAERAGPGGDAGCFLMQKNTTATGPVEYAQPDDDKDADLAQFLKARGADGYRLREWGLSGPWVVVERTPGAPAHDYVVLDIAEGEAPRLRLVELLEKGYRAVALSHSSLVMEKEAGAQQGE